MTRLEQFFKDLEYEKQNSDEYFGFNPVTYLEEYLKERDAEVLSHLQGWSSEIDQAAKVVPIAGKNFDNQEVAE